MSTDNLLKFEDATTSNNLIQSDPNDSKNNFQTISFLQPYEPSGGVTNSVNCQVCRNFINLDQKQNNLIVKCDKCNEATPIKGPPPGKKFVRCTCNGLLICKSTSTRVGCPRPHCQAVITIAPSLDESGVLSAVTSSTGLLCRGVTVNCFNCGSSFIFSADKKKIFLVAKCPYCLKRSSIGPYYARIRWIICLVFGIVLLALGITITVVTYKEASHYRGYYVAYIGLLLCGLILLIRGIIYFFMPISKIENETIQRI